MNSLSQTSPRLFVTITGGVYLLYSSCWRLWASFSSVRLA